MKSSLLCSEAVRRSCTHSNERYCPDHNSYNGIKTYIVSRLKTSGKVDHIVSSIETYDRLKIANI